MPATTRPLHRTNPFMEGLANRIQMHKKPGYSGSVRVLDQDTGVEGPEMAYFAKTRTVDSEAFVKFYADGVQLLTDLAGSGRTVLRAFIHAYMADTKNYGDVLMLTYRWASEDHGYPHGQKAWIKGVNELIEAEVIAKHENSMYFLNPAYFIKGDRVALVNEYRLRPIRD